MANDWISQESSILSLIHTHSRFVQVQVGQVLHLTQHNSSSTALCLCMSLLQSQNTHHQHSSTMKIGLQLWNYASTQFLLVHRGSGKNGLSAVSTSPRARNAKNLHMAKKGGASKQKVFWEIETLSWDWTFNSPPRVLQLKATTQLPVPRIAHRIASCGILEPSATVLAFARSGSCTPSMSWAWGKRLHEITYDLQWNCSSDISLSPKSRRA